MSEDSGLWMLLAGPASSAGLYWALYRYYRNTDKSHAFEHESTVNAKPVTGSDQKVNQVTGTQESRISNENTGDYRKRVTRIKSATDSL